MTLDLRIAVTVHQTQKSMTDFLNRPIRSIPFALRRTTRLICPTGGIANFVSSA